MTLPGRTMRAKQSALREESECCTHKAGDVGLDKLRALARPQGGVVRPEDSWTPLDACPALPVLLLLLLLLAGPRPNVTRAHGCARRRACGWWCRRPAGDAAVGVPLAAVGGHLALVDTCGSSAARCGQNTCDCASPCLVHETCLENCSLNHEDFTYYSLAFL